jgi:adenylosuccinate lyase
MRKYDIENPYEKLKELTRGKTVTKDDFVKFIDGLDMPTDEKK